MKSGSFTICCISGVVGIALEVVDMMMGVVDSYMMCLVDDREADNFARNRGQPDVL